MGTARRMQTFMVSESPPSALPQVTSSAFARNLRKSNLGGVIFGCKNSTKNECLFKQLFGLPAQHFSYVKNIDPGLPLFLFNYSDRKLHGIFEAASAGQMNINSYAWTTDGSERTQYPAQVQIRVRLHCQPLHEDQFKPIIIDNYYSQNHFWFELDHAQASKLISLLSSLAVAPSTFAPQNTSKWRTIFRGLPTSDRKEESQVDPPFDVEFSRSYKSNWGSGVSDGNNQSQETCIRRQMEDENDKDLIYMKLKEMVLNRERADSHLMECEDTSDVNDMNLGNDHSMDGQIISEENNEKNEESPINSSDCPLVTTQLIQEMEELKAFKTEQIHRMGYLEHKLAEAEKEIQQLKDRCMMLESMPNRSLEQADKTLIELLEDLHLELDDLIFLVGGYNGVSWLSALDCYSPSQDVIRSLRPMNSVRSYASVAKLNDELYVFGGGDGRLWYDSVESYNPGSNQWTSRPSLNAKKGSLAGATLGNKIFAIGGGNGIDCFSDVEMFDLDVGHWISTRSMLQKRFALAAAELHGAIYAVGGFDGNDYLKSAERFDPREHSWTKIERMNTKRGCHSLAVLNEKLYALGGYDGSTMVPSIEIFDPRLGTWITGESMSQSRGYAATAVVKESIYVIGGVRSGDSIVNTVECYQEGLGWQTTNLRGIGSRCFFSAIVLGYD